VVTKVLIDQEQQVVTAVVAAVVVAAAANPTTMIQTIHFWITFIPQRNLIP